MSKRNTPPWGMLGAFAFALALSLYFTFAAVQGDYGLFRRAEIIAQNNKLQSDLDRLSRQVARMENLTRRMSDDYLDLDLLDQQVRDILGQVRPDEIIIQ
jgi:cell division protein FtsB